MSEPPAAPWIHIGECPVCVNGLCRVRTCRSPAGGKTPVGNALVGDLPAGTLHFYAMCDECEALWLTPTTDAPRQFPDACEPKCPICQQPLYGEQAHWSHAEELQGTEWSANSIFDVPNEDSLDPNSLANMDDLSYGQDETKPDC